MGHAGAIISGGQGTAKEKYAAMRAAGIHTVESPAEIGHAVAKVLGKAKSPSRSKVAVKKKTASKSKKRTKKWRK